MYDPQADAVEIDYLVLLIVRFDSAADELGAGGAQVCAAAGSGIVTIAGRRRSGMKVFRLCEGLADET